MERITEGTFPFFLFYLQIFTFITFIVYLLFFFFFWFLDILIYSKSTWSGRGIFMVQRASKTALHGWVVWRHEPQGSLAKQIWLWYCECDKRWKEGWGQSSPSTGNLQCIESYQRGHNDVWVVTGTSSALGTALQGLMGTLRMSTLPSTAHKK